MHSEDEEILIVIDANSPEFVMLGEGYDLPSFGIPQLRLYEIANCQ